MPGYITVTLLTTKGNENFESNQKKKNMRYYIQGNNKKITDFQLTMKKLLTI